MTVNLAEFDLTSCGDCGGPGGCGCPDGLPVCAHEWPAELDAAAICAICHLPYTEYEVRS